MNQKLKLSLSMSMLLKFIYSEKVTKFGKIFTLLLAYAVTVKSKVKILQNFVAFSEYMNFKSVSTEVAQIKADLSFE